MKRSLGLPVSACSAFFYVPSSQGGLGLRSVEDDLGSLMIAQAVKMLTSLEPLVRGVAQHSLTLTVEKWYRDIEGLEDKWCFLAGQIRCQREGRRGDVSTIWSRVRNFVADRQIRLHGGTDEDPTPTSISIGAQDFSRNFRKILLQELRGRRGLTFTTSSGSVPPSREGLPNLSGAHPSPTTGCVTVITFAIESTTLPSRLT